jgi:uncharacterized protein (DUF2267 family)
MAASLASVTCPTEPYAAVELARLESERATAAVFHALRDRLTPIEADPLAGQLPAGLGTVWQAGVRPGRRPARLRREAFYERVRVEAGARTRRDAQALTPGVFAALKEAISPGEADDVRAQLSEDLEELWASAR